MGFVKIGEDKVSIPFGPIFTSDISLASIFDFIDEIKRRYSKNVVFSLPLEIINDCLIREYNLIKGWCFATPLVDTNRPIETVVKDCNENRRRIIKNVLQNIPQDNIRSGLQYAEEYIRLYKKRMLEADCELDLTLELLNKILMYNNSKLTVCLNGKKIIAGSITFEFGDTLITRYNCFDSEYYKISPITRVDYELLKYASENPSIHYFDMSGLASEIGISKKESNLNRYKLSYRPSKILTYQWYRY